MTGDGSKVQRTIVHGEMTEVYENDSISQYHPPPGPFYAHLHLLVSMITHLQEDLQIIISSLTPTQSTQQFIQNYHLGTLLSEKGKLQNKMNSLILFPM